MQRHLVLKHGLRKGSPYGGPASDQSPGQSEAGSVSTAENMSSDRQEPGRAIDLQEMNDGMDGHIQPTPQQGLALLPDHGQSHRNSGDYTYQTPPSYERTSIFSAPSHDRTAAVSSVPPEFPDGFDIGSFPIQQANDAARMEWLFDMQPELASGVVPGQPTSHAVQPLQSVCSTVTSHIGPNIKWLTHI